MHAPASRGQVMLLFILTFVLIASLYLPRLGMNPLINEETRRALVAQQMQQTEQYLLPHINGAVYTAKPPLYNWLLVISSSLDKNNITAFNARLPAVISCLILALGMIWFTRKWWSAKALLLFALSLLLAPEIIRKATIAELDMTFTLLINAGLWSWFTLYQRGSSWCWILGGLFTGLAFLCKREAALLCYFITLFGYLYHSGRSKVLISPAALMGVLTILVIAALWFIPVLQQLGLDGFLQQSQQQLQHRQHQGNWLSYLLSSLAYPAKTWVALLPFSLLLPLLFCSSVRQRLAEKYQHRYLFCMCAVLGNILPLMLLGDSNVRYFLPLMPFALILNVMIFELASTLKLPRWLERLCWLQLPIFLLLCVIIALSWLLLRLGNGDNVQLEISAVYLSIELIFMLILMLWYFVKSRVITFPALRHQFLIYCACVGISLRLLYFVYQQPYEANKVAQHRNLPQMLGQIQTISKNTELAIMAAANFAHGFYFYDEIGLIKAINCQQTPVTPLLWLRMSPKGLDRQTLQQSGHIAWFSPYRRNHFVYLQTVQTPLQKAAMLSQICPFADR